LQRQEPDSYGEGNKHQYAWWLRWNMILKWNKEAAFSVVDCNWNVMAHAQKTRFRLSAKRTSPFKSAGASV
jgi:hypothetical protein